MLGPVLVAPPPSLSDLVHAIWDLDAADCAAGGMALEIIPGVSTAMCAHYRAPLMTSRPHEQPRKHMSVLSGMQSGPYMLQSSGPVGAVALQFKPGAMARLFGEAFADANISLADVVGDAASDRLETQLSEAKSGAERLARVEAFLRPLARREHDAMVIAATQALRRSPALPIAALARALNISERQLERRFLKAVGATPKQFARILRSEKLIAARHRGDEWADIASACGFSDQAHMIRDFKALAGVTPQAFMRRTSGGERAALNAALAMSGFYNTAFV